MPVWCFLPFLGYLFPEGSRADVVSTILPCVRCEASWNRLVLAATACVCHQAAQSCGHRGCPAAPTGTRQPPHTVRCRFRIHMGRTALWSLARATPARQEAVEMGVLEGRNESFVAGQWWLVSVMLSEGTARWLHRKAPQI